jgi:hypothetical protein
MDNQTLTQERLKELLEYDAETGVFRWRTARNGRVKAGSVAGTVNADGYVIIFIDYRPYPAHRLVWLWVYGRWPKRLLDHENRVRNDNRIRNLREADEFQNAQNATSIAEGKGVRGTYWHKVARKWAAGIRHKGKTVYLGLFPTREEAHAAYLAAATRFHDFNPLAQ